MSNFSFLLNDFPALEKLGCLAEGYLHSDPHSCFIKLGTLGENIVKYMMELDGVPPLEYDNTHANRIKTLKYEDLLPRDIDNILYVLRAKRNKAAHDVFISIKKCSKC